MFLFQLANEINQIASSGENVALRLNTFSDVDFVYQLKKHYPTIFEKVMAKGMNECNTLFKNNIKNLLH